MITSFRTQIVSETLSWGDKRWFLHRLTVQAKRMPFALQHHDMKLKYNFTSRDSKTPNSHLSPSLSASALSGSSESHALAKNKCENPSSPGHIQSRFPALPHMFECIFSSFTTVHWKAQCCGNAIPHSHLGCGWGLKAASTSHRSRTWVLPMEFPNWIDL